MGLWTLSLILFTTQDSVPAVEEIIRHIEEKNRGLGSFEADLRIEGTQGFSLASFGSESSSDVASRGKVWGKEGEFVALDILVDVPAYDSLVVASAFHAPEGSAYRLCGILPPLKAHTVLAGKGSIATEYVAARFLHLLTTLVLDATVMPRAFLKGRTIVAKVPDGYTVRKIIQIPMREDRAEVLFAVDGSTWRIRAIEIDKQRVEVSEWTEVNGVRLPKTAGGFTFAVRSAPAKPPYWAQLDALPSLMPAAIPILKKKVAEQPSFETHYRLATAMTLEAVQGLFSFFSESKWTPQFYADCCAALAEAGKLRSDCAALWEALALAELGRGQEDAFLRVTKEHASPLLTYLAARRADSLEFAERIAEDGLFADLRKPLLARLRLRAVEDPARFVLGDEDVNELEPPLRLAEKTAGAFFSETKLTALKPTGALTGKSKEFCAALAKSDDPRIALMLARHWVKDGEFDRAEEMYRRVKDRNPAEIRDAVVHGEGRLGALIEKVEADPLLVAAILGSSTRVAEEARKAFEAQPKSYRMKSYEIDPLAKVILQFHESGADAEPLLRAVLPRLPVTAFFFSEVQITPAMVEAMTKISKGDDRKLFDLLLHVPEVRRFSFDKYKIDKNRFRDFLRDRIDSKTASKVEYELLADFVRGTCDSTVRRFKAADEDIERLRKGLDLFHDLVLVPETLADHAYANRSAFQEAAQLYERSLFTLLDTGALENSYNTGGSRGEWSTSHQLTIRLALAFRDAGDREGGLKVLERFRKHPATSNYSYRDRTIDDMRFILDPSAALGAAVDEFKKSADPKKVFEFLREQGRFFEAYAWSKAMDTTGQGRGPIHFRALINLLKTDAPTVVLDPVLQPASPKLEEIASGWRKGIASNRDLFVAAELASCFTESGGETVNPAEDDLLIPLLRRLNESGRKADGVRAFEAMRSKIGNVWQYYGVLSELSGGDRETIYRCLAGSGLAALQGIGLDPKEALALATGKIDATGGTLTDHLIVAEFAQDHPHDRSDLRNYLEPAVAKFPKELRLQEALGDDHYAGGRYPEALAAFARAAELTDASKTGVDYRASELRDRYHPETLLPIKIAWAATQAGIKDKGLEVLRRYRDHVAEFDGKKNPYDFGYGAFGFGTAFELLGDLAEARRALTWPFRTVVKDAGYASMVKETSFMWESWHSPLRLAGVLERQGEPVLAAVVLDVLLEAERKQEYRDAEMEAKIQSARRRIDVAEGRLVAWALPRVAESSDPAVDALIAELRSGSLEAREQALKKLEKAPSPAALKKYAQDPEVGPAVAVLLAPWAKEQAIREVLKAVK